MHDKGVVHRDLNPKNVFIRKNNETELGLNKMVDNSAVPVLKAFSPLNSYEVKVFDFNVSKLIED